MTATVAPTQVYRVYIKAPAEKIWQAITEPEWTNKYGYTGYSHFELKPGGSYQVIPNEEFKAAASQGGYVCPDVVVDGEVVEADPPHKLVQTYRFLFTEQNKAEGFTRVTWEIEATQSGFCRLTVTHELEGAPIMAGMVSSKFSEQGSGGWSWILSDLKSLLETGDTLAGQG